MGQCFNCTRETPVLFRCTACHELVCYICIIQGDSRHLDKPQICTRCQPKLENTEVQSP